MKCDSAMAETHAKIGIMFDKLTSRNNLEGRAMFRAE
jgi:hypothetical protein